MIQKTNRDLIRRRIKESCKKAIQQKDNSIEIITWNCEFFPANDDSTISALSEAVNDLSPDIVEFQEIIITDYIDCTTGLPCNSGMQEVLDKSKNTGLLYDLNGRTIKRAEGIYIENGLIKYKL